MAMTTVAMMDRSDEVFQSRPICNDLAIIRRRSFKAERSAQGQEPAPGSSRHELAVQAVGKFSQASVRRRATSGQKASQSNSLRP
eukprot:6813270-Pyramimonas_sp.AAC.1